MFSSFLRVWHCFFVVLALWYHLLYFYFLGQNDHVAVTFQVVSLCCQVVEDLCYHVAQVQVCASNIKRVTATFCLAVLSSHFDHVFLTFYVSDHVFSLFWPSATTFYTFLTLVILTMLHSLFRFSSLFLSDHVFSLFWPSATTFYIFLTLVILTMLHSLFRLFHNAIRCLSTSATMWHIFKSVRAILSELQPLFVWQYLVVILTMFSSLFTCLTMFFHCFGPLLPFLYFSYLGHFDHVALTFQVFFSFYVSDHVFSLFWPSATTFYIFLTLVILTMLHSLLRFSMMHCFGPHFSGFLTILTFQVV